MIAHILVAALCLTTGVSAINLALSKPATQSSAYLNYLGDRAVDGNTEGNWVKGQTCYASDKRDATPWWMVDLQDIVTVKDVTIYNRADGWGDRLRNLQVLVYMENPDVVSGAASTLCAAYPGPASNGDIVTLTCEGNAEGRYLRIVKTKIDANDLLSFCEVTVEGEAHAVSTANLAYTKPTTQSSAYLNYLGDRAVDGNTEGNWVKGQTCYASDKSDATPWWMVDLQNVVTVKDVTIYNRADGWGDRLRNLQVLVYKENPDVVSGAVASLCAAYNGPASNGDIVTLKCEENAEGRFVRIVKVKNDANDLLSFCEVAITGEDRCPEGFVDVDGECLVFSSTFATFAEAITYCEMIDSTLVMLKKESLDTAIQKYMNDNVMLGNYYVGASDMEEEKVYKWIDRENVVASWRPDNNEEEPIGVKNRESGCGYLNGTNSYQWEALPCHEALNFICHLN